MLLDEIDYDKLSPMMKLYVEITVSAIFMKCSSTMR